MANIYSSQGDIFLQMSKGEVFKCSSNSWIDYIREHKEHYSFSPELWKGVTLKDQINELTGDKTPNSIPELKELILGTKVEETLDALTLTSDFLTSINSNPEEAIQFFQSTDSLCPVWAIRKYSDICQEASSQLTDITEQIESSSSSSIENIKELTMANSQQYLEAAIAANEIAFKEALESPKALRIVNNTKTLELASLPLKTLANAYNSPFMDDNANEAIKQAYQSKIMEIFSVSEIPHALKAEAVESILEVSLASNSTIEEMPSLAKLGSFMTKLHHSKLPEEQLESIQKTLSSTISNRSKADKARFYIETPEHGDKIHFKSNMRPIVTR